MGCSKTHGSLGASGLHIDLNSSIEDRGIMDCGRPAPRPYFSLSLSDLHLQRMGPVEIQMGIGSPQYSLNYNAQFRPK